MNFDNPRVCQCGNPLVDGVVLCEFCFAKRLAQQVAYHHRMQKLGFHQSGLEERITVEDEIEVKE